MALKGRCVMTVSNQRGTSPIIELASFTVKAMALSAHYILPEIYLRHSIDQAVFIIERKGTWVVADDALVSH